MSHKAKSAAAGPAPSAAGRSIAVSIAGSLIGIAILLMAIGMETRKADEVGLGFNTHALFEPHPRGTFHFSYPRQLDTPQIEDSFAPARTYLWLGASQLYGVNAYRPGQHNVAYRVFDSLLRQGAAVLTLSMPLCFAQEHEILFSYALTRLKPSGLVIGAVYPDMRHETVRADIAALLDDAKLRARLQVTDRGRTLLARNSGAQTERATTSEPKRADDSLMTLSEQFVTRTLEAWIGMETLRNAGRTLIRLTLEDVRRYFESLRARYTRDLSRYRVPILPQRYDENIKAWHGLLQSARAEGIPVLVYIAPRPTDFYPFDPDGYVRFKAEIETMAREYGADFANIEDAVPNREWGEVDLSFGFLVRDPFHFTAHGHALMAEALLPHIERAFGLRAR